VSVCACVALLSVFVYVFLFSSAYNSTCHRVLSVTVVCIKQLEVGFGAFRKFVQHLHLGNVAVF
jgi:hypothetical protein